MFFDVYNIYRKKFVKFVHRSYNIVKRENFFSMKKKGDMVGGGMGKMVSPFLKEKHDKFF